MQTQNCEYFTWFGPGSSGPNSCVLYSACDTFNATICTDCYTGSKDCSLLRCSEPGFCSNSHYLASGYAKDADDCLKQCQSWPGCKWYSFDPNENSFCELTSDCLDVDQTCVNCIHGQVECQVQQPSAPTLRILVATGKTDNYNEYMDYAELVLIEGDNVTSCSHVPPPFPKEVMETVAMKHNDKMVICGGWEFTSDCYGYWNDGWHIEPFKLYPERYGSMSAEIRPNEWLVMGGYTDYLGYDDETKLLKNGIFTPGPDLPEPIYSGSAIMLNETHLFVAAAASMNYLLDIETDKWTAIAPRIPSTSHSSGIFYNSTADEIQIANIGYESIQVFSPKENAWTPGFPFPAGMDYLYASAAIQRGTDSFILIGGSVDLGPNSGSVYKFDENGLSVMKSNVLKWPRREHVALAISEEDCICN